MGTDPVDISVLIPCLNELGNVLPMAEAVITEAEKIGVTLEIVFIDNGSTDGTRDLLREACAGDLRIKAIFNNKNYGQMRSPTYGIYQTSGRAVIGISADFQEPVEMIGEFVARWRQGAKIVLGVRASEEMTFGMRLIRVLGYGFFERFADYRVIPGATGFGLYDRKVVETLKGWRDPEPFFRGMLVESGFEIHSIPYHRKNRQAGKSKNNYATLLNFALLGLASSSKRLLRLPLFAAAAMIVVASVTLFACLVSLVARGPVVPLFIIASAEATFALTFFFLGMMGEQIRIIAEMSRNAPLVVEEERINFPTV